MIEHAVYASGQSQGRDGYQILAASSGAAEEDLRELAVWCPSHDGLLDRTGGTPSLNAFPLPSGAHCVAQSFRGESEYSGRGGTHVVTHALMLAAEDYTRFSNNPFAVMQAAIAGGHIQSSMPLKSVLDSFHLAGRARCFDRAPVQHILRQSSPESLARVLDACLRNETTVLVVTEGEEPLMPAILNCLPVGVRSRISLATGLVYSPRRPYHWMTHHRGAIELRRLERSLGVRVVSLGRTCQGGGRCPPKKPSYHHNWVTCVLTLLLKEDYPGLERRMRDLASATNIAELDRLAGEVMPPQGASAGVPLAAISTNYPLGSVRARQNS